MATTKLAIGTGRWTAKCKAQGFVTLDANPDCDPDYVCEVPPLPIIGRWDYIEALHFWEHIYLWQAEELAKQLFDALAVNGVLALEMPNLRKCCEYFLDPEPPMLIDAPYHPDPRLSMWGIYGAQEDPKWAGNIWQVHKWGYTPETIKAQLERAGFAKVRMRPTTTGIAIRDMRVEAHKNA